jgi:hypothetical protein
VTAALVLLLLGSSLGSASAAAVESWGTPQRIGGPADLSQSDLYAPFLAANARGDVVAAWAGERGVDLAIARRGRDFAPAGRVPHSSDAFDPLVALGQHRDVAIAWDYEYEGTDPGAGCCWGVSVASRDALGHITNPRTISRYDEDSWLVDVAVGPGGRAAAWLQRVARNVWAGGSRVVFASGPGLWGPRFPIPGLLLVPQLRRGGGARLTIYDGRVVKVVDRSANGVLGSPHAIAKPGAGLLGLQADRLGAAAELVDRSKKAGLTRKHRLIAATRVGGVLAREQVLDRARDRYNPWEPVLRAAPSGAAVAAWGVPPLDYYAGDKEVRAAVRLPGRRFGRTVTVRSDSHRKFQGLCGAIDSAGVAVVAWRSSRSDGSPGIFAAVSRGGRQFGRPKLVSGATHGVLSYPAVVVPADGRAVVVWGRGLAVEAARLE